MHTVLEVMLQSGRTFVGFQTKPTIEAFNDQYNILANKPQAHEVHVLLLFSSATAFCQGEMAITCRETEY
jgi:hypothetical protein